MSADERSAGLARELVAMAEADEALRAELAATGELFDGYAPGMEALHRRHAQRLTDILDDHGWPSPADVGEQACEAAWLVLQHAIGDPPLQRRGAMLLADAVARGEASAARWAMLEDRIAVFEGRPQRYGTQLDWDEHGQLSPHTVEDPSGLDQRRAEVGLEPVQAALDRLRERVAAEGQRAPADRIRSRQEQREWARRAGWRD